MRAFYQAHNDGRVDIRHNTQSQYRESSQSAAGEYVEKTQHAAFVLLKEAGYGISIDAGYRNYSGHPKHRQSYYYK